MPDAANVTLIEGPRLFAQAGTEPCAEGGLPKPHEKISILAAGLALEVPSGR